MPKDNSIKKILIIGSGPIVIGQAAEFDYAGTQAIKALKREGLEVILLNNNPATIMTDPDLADTVYFEPLTSEFLIKIINKEKPDAVLPTMGGQVALNLAQQVAETGFFEKENIRLLGANLETIKLAEDRESFKKLMVEIGEPVPESITVSTVEEGLRFAAQIGYPIIVRPAYTLGGTGGGIANSEEELAQILTFGLHESPITQCLVEKSIAGFKELEYEMMRDHNDNCIVICNMENIDPVGVHTGESIVVCPSQTLTNKEHQMLRDSALKIIRKLNIVGGCNIQFALDTVSNQYYIIEVNPRVSRSSALASKATGYPIAHIATLLALGYTLDELKNPVTKKTSACFEPTIDYVVIKIPRWPFDKFQEADRTLGTQMKSTGEAMAIGGNFEEALLKGVRSLELGREHLYCNGDLDLEKIKSPHDERIFHIAEALRQGHTIESIHEITKIDLFYLAKIQNIIAMETQVKNNPHEVSVLAQAKRLGLCNSTLAFLTQQTEQEITTLLEQKGIRPCYKMVDTCAAEFASSTPYFYSTYHAEENEAVATDRKSIAVIGSGPIRIGQGVEFDYCTVHAIKSIQANGYEAIVINNNPETVSTDFNECDRLYFEPLTHEDVMAVLTNEKVEGVLVQFGGQTAINLAEDLHRSGITIMGTSLESTQFAEDREHFERILKDHQLPRPEGKSVRSSEEALTLVKDIGFPVIVRPSYVLGGRAMEIVYDEKELTLYLDKVLKDYPENNILIDRYLMGKEAEVDVISDGEDVYIPGVMEHIERAGVHSGDSMAVYPPQSLSQELKEKIIAHAKTLSLALKVKGLLNIQFVIKNETPYIIEANPRSSRTVPFLSKVTGVPMVRWATDIALGKPLKDLKNTDLIYHPEKKIAAIKAPIFSWKKITRLDAILGPEMKSTGELIALDTKYPKAILKALIGMGFKIPSYGAVLFTIAEKHKKESLELAKRFYDLGFKIFATPGTAKMLQENHIAAQVSHKLQAPAPNLADLIKGQEVDFVVNTITKGRNPQTDGHVLRKLCVERGIPCMTSLDTTKALLHALENTILGPTLVSDYE